MTSINEVRPSRRHLHLAVGGLIAVVFAAGSLLVKSGQSLAGAGATIAVPEQVPAVTVILRNQMTHLCL